MKNYTLSKEKIAELEEVHSYLRDKLQADRVKAVIALSKGWSVAQVAEILLFDEKTSRHYSERYQQLGLKALLDDHYSGAQSKLGTHQQAALVRYIEEPKNLEEYKFLYEAKEKTPSGWTEKQKIDTKKQNLHKRRKVMKKIVWGYVCLF